MGGDYSAICYTLLKIKILRVSQVGEMLYNPSQKSSQEVAVELGYERRANGREGDRLLGRGLEKTHHVQEEAQRRGAGL